MLELHGGQPIFIGFKMDGSLRRQLDHLTGADRRYVSSEDATFLSICRIGDDRYVGKLIDERLTTDRVDDVVRNVLSILSRLCPETRFPRTLEIVPCGRPGEVVEE